MSGPEIALVPTTYDERLARRVRVNDDNAPQAALTLFERRGPRTLPEAVSFVCPDLRPTPETFEAIAQAWERYRHLRDLPWD
jgi:hypothetical protein